MKFETVLPYTLGSLRKIALPKKVTDDCGIFPGSRVEVDAEKSETGALVLIIKRLAPLPEKQKEKVPDPWYVESGKNAALQEIQEREELSEESRHPTKGTSQSFDSIMQEALRRDLKDSEREARIQMINNGEIPQDLVGTIGFKIKGLPKSDKR